MPSANGQYRRQAVPERKQPQSAAERKPIPQAPAPPCPPPPQECKPPQEAPVKDCGSAQESRRNPLGAFGGLFKGLDSGDLLLLALLLLLLTEGSEDAAPMALTLAIALIL